jgi:hypothetical protein
MWRNGDLLLGLHTKIFAFLGHVGDGSKLSSKYVTETKSIRIAEMRDGQAVADAGGRRRA